MTSARLQSEMENTLNQAATKVAFFIPMDEFKFCKRIYRTGILRQQKVIVSQAEPHLDIWLVEIGGFKQHFKVEKNRYGKVDFLHHNGDIGISMEYVLGVYKTVHELPLSIFSLQMGDFLK